MKIISNPRSCTRNEEASLFLLPFLLPSPFSFHMSPLKANFLSRKIFCVNVNEPILANEIASFRIPWKIFLKRKLTKTSPEMKGLHKSKKTYSHMQKKAKFILLVSCYFFKNLSKCIMVLLGIPAPPYNSRCASLEKISLGLHLKFKCPLNFSFCHSHLPLCFFTSFLLARPAFQVPLICGIAGITPLL